MLHACGGSGYKRDMELERYVRDAKAGWVMGPTNEVLRQFVGKAVLLGFDALDYWNQTYNRRVVENEIKKLDSAGKRELAKELTEQAEKDEAREPAAGGLATSMADGTAGRRCSCAGLKPVDPAFESWWVQAGIGDGGGAARRRPGDGDRPGRRAAGRAHGARAGRARGRGGPRRHRRRPGHGRARPAWPRATDTPSSRPYTRAGCAPTTRARPALFGNDSPPGASQAFRAERDAVAIVAAPGGPRDRR